MSNVNSVDNSFLGTNRIRLYLSTKQKILFDNVELKIDDWYKFNDLFIKILDFESLLNNFNGDSFKFMTINVHRSINTSIYNILPEIVNEYLKTVEEIEKLIPRFCDEYRSSDDYIQMRENIRITQS